MKKLVFLFGIIGLLVLPANLNAQNFRQGKEAEHQSIEALAKEKTNKLMQELGLTTKQAVLVEQKLVEFLIYREKLTSNEKLSKKQLMARLKVLDNNKLSELRGILTDIQYDLYVKIK